MTRWFGIDFGTTNSAVAMCDGGRAALVPLDGAPTWRSVLYFPPEGEPTAGPRAIARYLEHQGEGRLVQSIKSHLASASFESTSINNRRVRLPELVAAFLRRLREAAAAPLGGRVVVGRPVRYWGATSDDDDRRAVARMTEALAIAGFDEVTFVHEPVAAASAYASRGGGRQRAIIADFGGGTSDFSVLEIGGGGDVEVLASAGIAIGGDSFDARIIDRAVAPLVGKGSNYRDAFAAEAPVPAWLFQRLRRWHLLSFLKAPRTLALLERIARGAADPAAIARLIAIVEEDLGLALHRAVETLKISLADEAGVLRFEQDPVRLLQPIRREAFESWIAHDLAALAITIDEALERAGLEAAAVDAVFATGGSSLVPAVRGLLRSRFPGAQLFGGEELTSVAAGLALHNRLISQSPR
jgi:hypothetical chaperone protein